MGEEEGEKERRITTKKKGVSFSNFQHLEKGKVSHKKNTKHTGAQKTVSQLPARLGLSNKGKEVQQPF